MKITPASSQATRLVRILAVCLPLVLAPLAAFAQGPGGGGGGFDPANMPPAMRANMEKMKKFRDENKQVFALSQTLRAFGDMDKDPRTKFTPPQAKTILGVINKWKTKPSLTNEQATQINKELTRSLTIPQIKQLAVAASQRGGWGGGGGGGGRPGGGGQSGGGGRPGGGGQGGPGGGGWKMPELKPFNPLNPETTFSRNKEMAKRRMSEMTTMLAARANGK